MKEQLINRTLMPTEPSFNRALIFGENEEKFISLVRNNFKMEDIYDTYDHDMAVSFPFAEYLSYHYVTVRTEEGYRHKKGGEWFSTTQVWDEYNQPKK